MKQARLRHGAVFGGILGAAYVVNVQALTWIGLGLTSWVIAGELLLLAVAVVAFVAPPMRGQAPPPGAAGTLLGLATMVGLAGLIQQLYMVLYTTTIFPGWVDMVVEIRTELLAQAGVSPDDINARMVDVRAGFTPLRMLTLGVLIPGLWKLATAVIVAVAARPFLGRSSCA